MFIYNRPAALLLSSLGGGDNQWEYLIEILTILHPTVSLLLYPTVSLLLNS